MSDNELVSESEQHNLLAKMCGRDAEKALASGDMAKYNQLMAEFKEHRKKADELKKQGK